MMGYVGYGKAFKEVRTQHGLPLSYFQKFGIDKTDLSRFERGQSMMGLERVDIMLQAMNVSLSEYELILNHFVADFQEEFLYEIDAADFAQDRAKLEKLYEEARSSGYGWLALAAKARFESLSSDEVQKVLKFLKKVQVWGYFELSIAYFVLDNLDTATIEQLMEDFENKNKNYYGIFKYRRRILQIAYRAVLVLAARGEKRLVEQILMMTDVPNRAGIDIYTDNLRQLAQGVAEFHFGQEKVGLEQIRRVLENFSLLGHEDLAAFYAKKNEGYLN